MKPLCRLRIRALARYAALAAPLPAGTRLARHVASCEHCRGVWEELRDLAGELSGHVAAPARPATFMEGVWDRVASAGAIDGCLEPPLDPDGRQWQWGRGGGRRYPAALAAVAAVLLIVLLFGRPMVLRRVFSTGWFAQRPGSGTAVVVKPPPKATRQRSADAPGDPARERPRPPLMAGMPQRGSPPSSPRQAAAITDDVRTSIRVHPRPSAADTSVGDDLARLNDGSPPPVPPFAPRPAVASSPRVATLQERTPGGVILDDLLALNPIRVAAADDTGLGTAAAALAAEAPTTDARLQQKVIVHATSLRIADLLERLTRATGVSLMARLEVADEKVSLWSEERTLIEVMRDLRHLHGYYWSRYGAAGKYSYALWQDAQSRAQEEAELQQWVVDQQRAFAERVERAVRALNAGDGELKRLAQQDPYLIVQIKHPVVRSAYRLFATLAPDQQALLTRGQTPSRGLPAGHLLEVSLLDSRASDPYWTPLSSLALWAPRGDMVTLTAAEMTPAQRAAVTAMVREGAAQWEHDATRMRGLPALDQEQRQAYQISQARTLAAADLQTATVTLFRCGDPAWQSLSVRVEVQSGGRSWMVRSSIGLSSEAREFYNNQLRRGEFDLWPPGQAEADRLLGHDPRRAAKVPGAAEPTSAPALPDPILEAPISLAWPLPSREGERALNPGEIMAALHRDIRRPLVVDTALIRLSQPLSGPAEFRAERRPLRQILQQVAPGMEYRTYGGVIFISDPQRLRWRLNALPRSVEALLQTRTGPFTLDDMALLARSLSPWQITKLGDYLPRRSIDQLIAAQELLKLYGELAPAQRSALTQGLSFSALTPPQQQWFLACAQRQRPSMESWRFQHGGLRLFTDMAPSTDYDGLQGPARPVARMVFQVSFPEEDTQSLPIDLFPQKSRRGINSSPSEWVGKRFPFLSHSPIRGSWKAALADERLRKRSIVLVLSRPFVDPYVGLQPPPAADPWVRALAERLQDTSVTVVHIRVPGWDTTPPPREDPRLPHLIQLRDDGEGNGQPVDASVEGRWIAQWPTVLVVGSDEIVQSVFEGQGACDIATIERAARQLR